MSLLYLPEPPSLGSPLNAVALSRTGIHLALVLWLLVVAPAAADLPLIDPDSWINRSDTIVVGVLEGVSQWREGDFDHGKGILRVAERIAGGGDFTSTILLEWSNHKNLVCPRIRNAEYAGKVGLWFFRRQADGRLNSAPIFITLEEETEIRFFSGLVDKLPITQRVLRVRQILRDYLRRDRGSIKDSPV